MELTVTVEDPWTADVQAVLARHLAFAGEHTPADHVHALPAEGLTGPDVTLFGVRRDGALLGVGALKALDAEHAELKSMHVLVEARGQGLGRVIVEHLLAVAAERGHRRVSLETGTMAAFDAARTLYADVGFVPCEPYADYTSNPYSACMTLELPAGLAGR